ncbi:hypothetical protein HBI38_096120 [Parastagonospora nodorum]|nr:hypothetical protein HBH71_132190 [Parastagonospora nodorum]KAH5154421.1 hypothetical protein HBI73_064470 [Parastagonospora nodorum]KAH6270379.1 hypothetical protein HBI41_084460 [Parastagonospora nodorum]KAH6289848.1 hypothetical protein HBI40_094030 [Parastagonospora nodorum]KAH6321905.1 hypothetical protein HBI38_096120 [Parastagonospora nodorum]
MATHKRTRTGCWTCREAGYKCDEQKPFCGRCMRLKITCKGYGVKLKWQDDNIATPAKKPRRAKRKTNLERSVVRSPGSVVSFASRSGFSTSPRDHASPGSSYSLPLGSFASTPGPFTSPRDFVGSPASMHSFPIVASPSFVIDMSTSDRWLLQYWVQRLSSLISVAPRKDYASPFQLHLTAMIHDSSALRSTVLSMAANHLALSSNDSSWKIHAFRHQQDAIHELQDVIQDPNLAITEPALATVLMMQVSARLFGDDDDASVANHLAGAKAMITRRGNLDRWSTPSSTKFLLSLFAYHDILSSVSRGARPLADHDANFAAVEGEPEMESIAKVLLAVARISQLQHAIKARKTDVNDMALSEEENATGRDIQQSLLAMEFPSGSGTTSDISSTAEAYRHAAFIYLYRTWLDIGAPNPISMDHVQRCLEYIQQVHVDSSLTSAHIWPLFTAGCEAIDSAYRQFVRDRFEEMYTSKRFPSLRRVMRDIEDVWGAKDTEEQMKGQDGMAKVDCIQVILKRRGREVDLA